MFFKSNEYVKYLEKENRKIKKENVRFRNELEAVKRYKTDYENLIKQVTNQKNRYIELNDKLNVLIKECQEQLDDIM